MEKGRSDEERERDQMEKEGDQVQKRQIIKGGCEDKIRQRERKKPD